MIYSIIMAICVILIIVCVVALVKLIKFIPQVWDCTEDITIYDEDDLKEMENV